jgi:hypothetical protein
MVISMAVCRATMPVDLGEAVVQTLSQRMSAVEDLYATEHASQHRSLLRSEHEGCTIDWRLFFLRASNCFDAGMFTPRVRPPCP